MEYERGCLSFASKVAEKKHLLWDNFSPILSEPVSGFGCEKGKAKNNKQLRALSGCHHGHKWSGLIPLTFPFFFLVAVNLSLISTEIARWTHQHAAQTDTHANTSPGFRRGFSLSVGVQEFTVTHSSRAPTLLSLSSSSLPSHTVRLRSCWDVFYSFLILVSHFHYTFPSLVLYFLSVNVHLHLSRCTTFCPPPCLARFNLKFQSARRFIVPCVDFVSGIKISVLLSHPRLSFSRRLSPACRVCLLCLGLQHISAAARCHSRWSASH